MKTQLDCIPCFMKQALDTARMATDDEATHLRAVSVVSEMMPVLPFEVSPPQVTQKIHRLIHYIAQCRDPYLDMKAKANRDALAYYPQMKRIVASSRDPLLAACKLAIAGNSSKLYSANNHNGLESAVMSGASAELAIDDFELFKKALEESSTILYLGDNAGEIVFDRILIEQLKKSSDADIIFVTRESPIMNDVTLQDAISVGIDKIVNVMPSGSDAPAIIPFQCSPQMQQLYLSADMVISKGQGNYEALDTEPNNIFFLMQVKCSVVANALNQAVGSSILHFHGEPCAE